MMIRENSHSGRAEIVLPTIVGRSQLLHNVENFFQLIEKSLVVQHAKLPEVMTLALTVEEIDCVYFFRSFISFSMVLL